MANEAVIVTQRLKTFPVPSTTAKPSTGFVSPGAHRLMESRSQQGVTYARIGADTETWICVSWMGTSYGVLDEEPGEEHIQPGLSIPESALTNRLAQFKGFTYSLDQPRYLETPVPGHRYPIAPPRQNNCCVFQEDLVVGAFRATHPRIDWTLKHHEMAMVADPNDLYSPPRALVDAKMATASSKDPRTLPRPWSACQGWRSAASGHTFIVLAVHAESRKVCTLESNFTYGMNGPGMRGLGDLDQLTGGPPAMWWTNPKVPTWEDLCASYRMGIQRCSLHVTSPAWGRIENG